MVGRRCRRFRPRPSDRRASGRGRGGNTPRRCRRGCSLRALCPIGARSRAYRWGEDGIAGICDRHQRFCFALALWNGRDPILKERLFGLDRQRRQSRRGCQGVLLLSRQHADALLHEVSCTSIRRRSFRTRSWCEENRRRGRTDPEFELLDTGVFDEDRYFDVFVEYAKADAEDILIRITVVESRAGSGASFTCCRHSGFATPGPGSRRARAMPTGANRRGAGDAHARAGSSITHYYGRRWLALRRRSRAAVYRERNQSQAALRGGRTAARYVKDGIQRLRGARQCWTRSIRTRRDQSAAHYQLTLAPGESTIVQAAAYEPGARAGMPFDGEFDEICAAAHARSRRILRRCGAAGDLSEDARQVMRQAFAGLLWSSSSITTTCDDWLKGDPGQPAAAGRARRRPQSRMDASL